MCGCGDSEVICDNEVDDHFPMEGRYAQLKIQLVGKVFKTKHAK